MGDVLWGLLLMSSSLPASRGMSVGLSCSSTVSRLHSSVVKSRKGIGNGMTVVGKQAGVF